MHRVLAVDPGDQRIGIALSDPTGMIANPLTVIKHVSRLMDAGVIAQLAVEHEAEVIVVGQALDAEGGVGPQARKAGRLAEAIRSQFDGAVVLWDESGSTQAVKSAAMAMGVRKKRRTGHLDDIAATYILQSYLDGQGEE